MKTLVLLAWTALAVYSDGKVATYEGMQSEQLCREVKCALDWGKSCAAHDQDVIDTKEAERKQVIIDAIELDQWRHFHPCTFDKKKEYMWCSTPRGGERTFSRNDKGKWDFIGESFSSTVTTLSSSSPTLTYSACFEAKK